MNREQAIERFKRFVETEGETLGRLLVWAERRVLEETLRRLSERGHRGISFAQLQLMQELCLTGVRVTDLAERMGSTKQAVGQITNALEERGLVRRSPDPKDGRANVVGYTAEGYRFIADAIDITIDVERDIAARVGKQSLAGLKKSLAKLIETSTAEEP